ncbi:MAG: hypothetical protein QG659_349 [Patescibacteria group bacterium]|jgi:hypothetical protein|nr:hypothetical protein [Patescibacteria group bacterium]
MARVNKTQQSPEHTPMFDLQEGVLIDGLSPEELLECGVDPRDTVPLSDIFADDTITHGYDSAKYNCDDWTKEDYRRWGKWISGFVQSPTPTRADYITAYKLGLGPHPKRIKIRFGSLWNFHDEAELDGGFCRGKYSDWTNRDFLAYGQEVVLKRGGKKPDEATLQRHFVNRRGPSPSLIYTRFGSLRNFHEHLGYPNIHSWDKDDYIDYGIKVAEANDIPRPSRTVFDKLSKNKRGASARSIINHFGKLSDFQDTVEQERHRRAVIQQQESYEKALARWDMILAGNIPSKLFAHDGPHDVSSFVQQTSRYLLVEHSLPREYPEAEKIAVALKQPRYIIRALQLRGSALSAGEMEVWASTNGLFDEIWPDDAHLVNLRIKTV